MSEYPAAPPTATAPASVPGKGLGIAGLILAIVPFTWVIGLILSIIAKVISRKAGVKNTPATAGIIVASIFIVLAIVGVIVGSIIGVNAVNDVISDACVGVESGEVVTSEDGSVTLTCP
jgi:hypothetical protein